MSNEEAKKRLYKINVGTRHVRSQMKRTLELAGRGDFDEAMELFEEAEMAFNKVKQEHSQLKEEVHKPSWHMEEQEGSIEFTEIIKDTVRHVASRSNGRCSAIRFHIYN